MRLETAGVIARRLLWHIAQAVRAVVLCRQAQAKVRAPCRACTMSAEEKFCSETNTVTTGQDDNG